MNSSEWLFPRVRVRPADTELSHGYCGTGLTVAVVASAVTVGAGAAGAVATTLVMVTTLVTNTVTTLVTVMILVCATEVNVTAANIRAAKTIYLVFFINEPGNKGDLPGSGKKKQPKNTVFSRI